jgi:hypothetical protein
MISTEQPKRGGRHDKHIDRRDAGGLIAQELRQVGEGVRGLRNMYLATVRLADLDAELEQFAVDPGRTPERVDGVHLPNQIPNFTIH